MRFNPLSSAILKEYAWVPSNVRGGPGLLAVRFHDGAEWWYRGVPERVFEDFLMSESRGSFFRRFIEPVYEREAKPANE